MLPPREFVPDRIWLIGYPIRYFGTRFNATTVLIRCADGSLIVHSPGPLDGDTKAFVDALGPVAAILAPGTFHHFYARDWADHYASAQTWICPGLERKIPSLLDYPVIEDGKSYPWSDELLHLNTKGSWLMNEVLFCHRPTHTLLVTDVIENFTDQSYANWVLKLWFKVAFRMWNNPKPAPEYQLFLWNRKKARAVLETVLSWDFERIVVGHGEPITHDAKSVARRAWRGVLGAG